VRVLLDTNIALDFLLQREPFFQDAELLFRAIDEGEIVAKARDSKDSLASAIALLALSNVS
jgi:predicted nucleic acid-binding protein